MGGGRWFRLAIGLPENIRPNRCAGGEPKPPTGAETTEGDRTLPRSAPGRRRTQWESTSLHPRSECKKEGPTPKDGPNRCAGGDVLSHRVPPAVPSAQQSLTTVFGMGTGVSSALRPPATNVEAVKQASSKQRVEKRRGRPQEGPTYVQACVSLK